MHFTHFTKYWNINLNRTCRKHSNCKTITFYNHHCKNIFFSFLILHGNLIISLKINKIIKIILFFANMTYFWCCYIFLLFISVFLARLHMMSLYYISVPLSPSATLSSTTVIFSSSSSRFFKNLTNTPLVKPLELSSKASASWHLNSQTRNKAFYNLTNQCVYEFSSEYSMLQTYVAYPKTMLAVTLRTMFGVLSSWIFLKN